MKDLLSKLSGNGGKGQAGTSGSSDPDVKAMSTIMSRLNESTHKVAKQARKNKNLYESIIRYSLRYRRGYMRYGLFFFD